jgi:hypothetical protein
MKWLIRLFPCYKALEARAAELHTKLTNAEYALTVMEQTARQKRADTFHRGYVAGYRAAMAELEGVTK